MFRGYFSLFRPGLAPVHEALTNAICLYRGVYLTSYMKHTPLIGVKTYFFFRITTTSSPTMDVPPNVGSNLPVSFNTSTSPSVTVPKAATTAWLSNFRVRSRKPSGPATVQSKGAILPMNGTKGVATSSRADLSGDTPANFSVATSILVTSKVAVPRIATGNTP